jgi:hypothetical protein
MTYPSSTVKRSIIMTAETTDSQTTTQILALQESVNKIHTCIEASIKLMYNDADKFNHTIRFSADGENSYLGTFRTCGQIAEVSLKTSSLPSLVDAVVRYFEIKL